ncbi:MAG: polyketide synthase PksN, partial [Pseudomonadota bacterium]|nr:polyketide synthase PksN [Pseudomonadota bacterium]
AANVLHATQNLSETLRHSQSLLKTHGLLLLNEISRPQDFATLTFGLTPGWWRYADEEDRLPHGPAAHPRQWLRLLHDAGFANAAAFPEPEQSEAAAFQCVLIAESEGWLESDNRVEPSAVVEPPRRGAPPLLIQGGEKRGVVDAQQVVENWLAGIIAAVLKLEPDTLEPQEPFERYGLESLAVLEIIARLESDLGKLPKTLLFEYVTLRQLAAHLLEQYRHSLETTVLTSSPPTPDDSATDIPSLDKEGWRVSAGVVRPADILASPLVGEESGVRGAEPIAIVGLSGRYPGAADLNQFWDNLWAGRSAITPVPPERWDNARYCDPEQRDRSKSYTPYGGFLRDIDAFDAPLFHLSPREARAMDPQERLFLETIWATLEDAGYTSDRLAQRSHTADGSDVGVFAGVMYGPYQWLALDAWAQGQISDAYSAHWSIANRVSYLFDFHGPSLAVDTACSSSLTAIHLACESIRRGECRAALAGGVNLVLHPLHHIALSRMQMVSPGPECRAFGEGADGFVSGEGVGAVLLRPLRDALRDGDRIWGVIRGSAVNAGGRTTGYTVPSPKAQASVIAAALRQANVDPRTLSYLEAHGTGTKLGDPVEIQGLRQAFAQFTGDREFCAIGSVKSNIGHLEAAAGIAALTKVLLQLHHRQLAPTLYVDSPNPLIPFAESPFQLQQHGSAWSTSPGTLRRAGISSFGAGGANVHLIVEEAPSVLPIEPATLHPQLIVLSAQQPESLTMLAARLRNYLRGLDALPPLAAIAYTLQVGRQALPERWATVVGDTPQLLAALDAFLAGSLAPTPAWRGRIQRDAPRHCATAPMDEAALAQHWLVGGEVDWDSFYPDPKPQRLALPSYPFARKRYWLTDPGFAEEVGNRELPNPEPRTPNPVSDYYDATARSDAGDPAEQFLSLAPLPQPLPDFSWTLAFFAPERYPQQRRLLRQQQEELRQVLLRKVDFQRVATVFDFGCGVGADLLRLAQRYPHLRGAGYTLSVRQCQLANQRFAAAGLGDRLRVDARDSAVDPFPGAFDLIMGVEVAHHIADKPALFANLARHLNPAGQLVLADCVAPTTAVPLPDTGSFTLNHAQYSELLSQHGLRIVDCVDASVEIAHGLHDADFDRTLAQLQADPASADQIDLLIRTHRSWDHFGKALQLCLIRYLLLTLIKDVATAPSTLLEANRAMLEHATPYGQVLPGMPPAADSSAETVTDLLRRHLATVLQFEVHEIDPDARFAELGMDSLTGLRFLDAVNQALGLSLGVEVTYNHSSINDLSAFITREHGGQLIKTRLDQAPPYQEQESNHPGATRHPSLSKEGNVLPETRVEPSRNAPVAIIGLATRFAGAANHRQFWRNLAAGVDVVGEVPPHRWRIDQHYDPDPQRTDASYGKWCAFLDDYDRFDPLFFNLSPREAESMDPQQRLFLEECWKALEDAGYAESSLAKMRCGVYAGVLGNEYADLLQRHSHTPDAYQMLGNAASILAARIAYTLNLKGPSLSLDTACSSGLVAMDLACKALQRGDIDLALAGGVSLYLSERPFILMSRAGMLSPTGRCRTFDAAADGIVTGEGVGVVVLKPLAQALADRDHIYGVIIASGTNQDGRTNGITAPSGDAQTALIRELYQQAGIDPATIRYIEAHGTGTTLGDPIEVSALGEAFRPSVLPRQSIALGSVKSNIGHTAAASGIAGLAKILLSLQHGQLPPSLHFQKPNPRIHFENTPFYVNDRLRDWPEPRRAALSAFGFSGTNAHAVIDPAPPLPSANRCNGPWLFTVSAKTATALDQRLAELADFLETDGATLYPGDVSFTLNVGRTHFAHRAAFVAADFPDLIRQCRSASLPPGGTGAGSALTALANEYQQGGEIDWTRLYAEETVGRVSLPTYPFARERYWCDPKPNPEPRTPNLEPSWLFRRIWQDAPLTATAPLPSPLLLFSEDAALAAACRAQAATVIQVIPGAEYHWRDAQTLTLQPAQTADYRQLLNELRQRGIVPGAIWHGWAIADLPGEGLPALTTALAIGLHAMLALTSALIPTKTPTRVLFCHSDAATVAGAAHSAVAGLARSLAATGRTLTLCSIALSSADRILNRLLMLTRIEFAQSSVGAIRYQDGRRQTETVTPLDSAPRFPNPELRTVLITGGLGGVGFALAKELARRQPVRLALLGRSPLDSTRQQRLDELTALGAEARYFRADVAQPEALQTALDAIHTHFGELHGIIHAAGILDPRPLETRSESDWQAVLAAKLQGAVLLDELTRDQPLRAFLLCSSMAATVGDFGFGDYAAANRFLSEFATRREVWRQQGHRQGVTVAVEWPLWESGGMRFLDQGQALFQQISGIQPLTAEQGGQILQQALALGEPAVLAAAGDRDKLLNYLNRGTPEPRTPNPESRPLLRQELRQWLAEVTRLPIERLEDQVSFSEYGFDSILLKESAIAIGQRLGIDLSPTVFYAHGTVADLSQHLLDTHPHLAERYVTSQAVEPLRRFAPPLLIQGGEAAGALSSVVSHLEPIAVIGMSGRFPQSPDLAEYWQHLAAGDDLVGSPPAERLARGVTQGGFIADPERFDAAFFQISPHEAELMDPQQRLFLEESWRALEDAGYRPSALAGRRCGVFVGVQSNDYLELLREVAEPQMVAGTTHALLANRISWLLDWRGPSEALDTACSSSLVAVHRAMQALRAGECELALAGGVNLLLAERSSALVDAMGVLSPSGRCRTFDRAADGYVRGEGVGVVVLKPLSRALADGDAIHGVLLASGVNHGGRASSLTAPNPEAQAALLTEVWSAASIPPATISYLEAHGTGTELGDPIEVEGIQAAFAELAKRWQMTLPAQSCGLGSVKSNIGHLEPASGVAGLIKVLLALRHHTLPAT